MCWICSKLVPFGAIFVNFEQFVQDIEDIVPTNIYLFKVNNRDTRKGCEICSKLTIKTLERHCRFGVFIVNFEHIS